MGIFSKTAKTEQRVVGGGWADGGGGGEGAGGGLTNKYWAELAIISFINFTF